MQNNKQQLFCFGFLFFTKKTIRTFLAPENAQLIFVKSATNAINKGFNTSSSILAWGKRGEQEAKLLSEQYNCPVWTVEDGFIRSAGLGSDFSPPASLVIDKLGIYYDPRSPSGLEVILQNHIFSDSELIQARDIRNLLVKQSISKYNLGSTITKETHQLIKEKYIILIPGQVEDDASIQKGCVDIRTNTDLIKAVRLAHTEAFLIYKPHPDVISGNRNGRVDKEVTEKYCDAVFEDTSITDCLEIADEVHTMTSLTGLEALMRDCKVVCYGIPFYSGWGLTHDRHTQTRRTRKRSLEELIAATYIIYPRYIDWESGQATSAEIIIKKIGKQIIAQGGKQATKISKIHRLTSKLVNISKGFMGF